MIHDPENYTPEYKKALSLCIELDLHCKKFDVPEGTILSGVMLRATEHVRQLEHKAYEKGFKAGKTYGTRHAVETLKGLLDR